MTWHNRTIDLITSRLKFLENLVKVEIHKASKPCADIEISFNLKDQVRKINIEVQQFDSGAPWKLKTIPSWKRRHDLATLIIFTEPTLERVLEKKQSETAYDFFKNEDVFLFQDKQLNDIISLIIYLIFSNRK